jgi:hypothetical protein
VGAPSLLAFLLALFVVAIWLALVATLASRERLSRCMMETSHGPERSWREIVSGWHRDARVDRRWKIAR